MGSAAAAQPAGALVIVESMWGNTRAVAQAVAEGLAERLSARVVDVADAPAAVGDHVDLLVVGGPTHAFSMSRAATRADAVSRGASAAGSTQSGIREWLDSLAGIPPHVQVAVFDTKVRKPHLPGSAAHAAARRLRKKGARAAVAPQTFYVVDTEGPLQPGERDRARAWGAQLGALCTQSVPAGDEH